MNVIIQVSLLQLLQHLSFFNHGELSLFMTAEVVRNLIHWFVAQRTDAGS